MAEKLPPMSEAMKAHFKKSGKTLDEYNEARRARMKRKKATPKPKPAPTPTETRAERAARMRAAAKSTPSISQEDVTRQTKARRATSGQRPTAETHGSNWQTAAGKWDRERRRTRTGAHASPRAEGQRRMLKKQAPTPTPTPEEEKE